MRPGLWEKLTYVNERGESVVFSRASMYHTNFKDVTGLSDVRNEIYSVSSMGQDGDTLVGTRIAARDIEIVGHLKTTDKERKYELRRKLNHALDPHQTATLTFEFNGVKRVISCLPDSSPIFYRRRNNVFEEFVVRLTCLNPYWRDQAEARVDVAMWEALFEFPLENEGLEIIADEWQIGQRTMSVVANVINSGDVGTGIRVSFKATGTVVNPQLTDMRTGEFMRINMTMEAGDEIVITTGYGEKAVKLIKDGEESNVFRLFDVDSVYLQTRPGDNLYRYDAAEGADVLDVTIWHKNYYLGVG